MATEHDRACWGVLRRTKGDAAFPEVIPLCATRVVIGRRPEHYEAPDTVFSTASAHDDALPDVALTQIDRVALAASKRLSKVHCIFQRTEDTNAVVEVHTNNGFAVNQAPVGKGTRASLSDGDAVQLLGDGPGQPGVLYALALRGAPTWRAGAVFYDEAVVAALRARGETRRATLKALREVATRLEATNSTVVRATDTRHRLIMKRRGRDERRALVDGIAAARGAAADAFEGGQAALAAGRAALAAVASRGPVLAAPASGDALEPDALDAVLPTPTPVARPEPNALEPYAATEPTDGGGSGPQSDADVSPHRLMANCAACAVPLADTAPQCITCGTRYCSAACQVAHWRGGHKQVCKRVKWGDDGGCDRSAVVAPDPEHVLTETTSKFWGLSWPKGERRWQAYYKDATGKTRNIGYFDTQEAAAHAVNAAISRAGLEGRRKTNPVVDGQLVPRALKAKGHGRPRDHRRRDKRRREEPAAATPSTRARRPRHAVNYAATADPDFEA